MLGSGYSSLRAVVDLPLRGLCAFVPERLENSLYHCSGYLAFDHNAHRMVFVKSNHGHLIAVDPHFAWQGEAVDKVDDALTLICGLVSYCLRRFRLDGMNHDSGSLSALGIVVYKVLTNQLGFALKICPAVDYLFAAFGC